MTHVEIDVAAVKQRVATLKPMERQIVQLMVKGYRVNEIGPMLHRSKDTITTHIWKIKAHLGVKNQYQFGYYLYIGGVE